MLLRINAPQGVSLDYTTQQMQKIEELIQPMRDSGEIRSHLRECRPERLLQFRLHGDDAGALGRAQPQPAGDHGRDQPADQAGAERARLPGAAQQPRHPRRRQRPAVRAGRQRPQGARRRGGQDHRRDAEGPALPDAAPVDRPDAAAAGRRHRPRARLRSRHRHHRARQHHAGHARRQRRRRRLHRRPQLWREAGLDHQSDQRSDRSGKHLPEDRRRPLRADVDHRHADRTRRAAVAVARTAAAIGGHHLQPLQAISRSATR